MKKIGSNALLRSFSDEQLDKIRNAGSFVRAAPGDRLLEEGHVPQTIFFLLEGEVEVLLPDPADRSSGKRLATLRPGDSFGEYGFIDRRPVSASVYVTIESQLFALPIKSLDELLPAKPDMELLLYKNLTKVLVDRLRAGNVLIDLLR